MANDKTEIMNEEIRYQLLNSVMDFIKNNKITCRETIYQCDWVIENAYDFINELFEIVEPLIND